MDIQPDKEDNAHVSAFLSWLSFTDQTLWLGTPAHNPRLRKAGTLFGPMARHGD
jgi:hypothetical protein